MFEWNDILIVGDSFCVNRQREYEWPQQVVCALTEQAFDKNNIPRGQGFPGASWWSTRTAFFDEVNCAPVKLVIFCHTDSGRIPSDTHLPLNFASKDTLEDKKLSQAVKGYYEHLWSDQFHRWAKQSWLCEVDNFCKEQNIKAVHLHCFDDNNYTFRYGLTVEEPLKTHAVLKSFDPYYSDVSNHLVPILNIRFGQNLAKLIKEWDGTAGVVTGSLFDDSGFQIKKC